MNVCLSTNKFLPIFFPQSNLTEYYNAVDSTNMMQIFASMLFERRIIIRSKRLKRLSACVQSANDLIYPMHWQHIFIPVLPLSLIEYLSAPMPFLVGVPEEVMKVRYLSWLVLFFNYLSQRFEWRKLHYWTGFTWNILGIMALSQSNVV